MLYADPGDPRRVPRHVIVHLNANKKSCLPDSVTLVRRSSRTAEENSSL